MTGGMLGETIIYGVITLIWVVLLLGLAGLAFMRFRTTLSGMLLTGGFALWAGKLAVFFIASSLMPSLFDDPMPYFMVQTISSSLLSLLLLLAIGAGVAFIPRSLRSLTGR